MTGGQDAPAADRTRIRDETSREHRDPREPTRQRSAATERLAGRPALVLGRYRLERRLGAGGFGVVWLAWDEQLEREVAVKAIPIEGDEPATAGVEREARAAARLNHPGIVVALRVGRDEHDIYLVSELVRGERSRELLRAGAALGPRCGADRDRTLRRARTRARAGAWSTAT